MCRNAFYALLCVSMPLALLSAFFYRSIAPMAIWVIVTIVAASMRKSA